MGDYEDEVSKMPRRRATSKEAQQWRYGSVLDEKRIAARQAFFRYLKWIGSAIPLAAAVSSILKNWWHG